MATPPYAFLLTCTCMAGGSIGGCIHDRLVETLGPKRCISADGMVVAVNYRKARQHLHSADQAQHPYASPLLAVDLSGLLPANTLRQAHRVVEPATAT